MASKGFTFCFIFNMVQCVISSQIELSINIAPGKEECFYSTVKNGEIIEVEYQVVNGGNGDLDVTFNLRSPSKVALVSDVKESDNNHRLQVSEPGEYSMCWDNTFSRLNSKLVFLVISVQRANATLDVWRHRGAATNRLEFDVTDTEIYEIAVDQIQSVVGRVRGHLHQVRHDQDISRVQETRDRNLAEKNCSLVLAWSLVQLVVMMAVGALQVLMVRSLFEQSSAFNCVWRLRMLG